MQHEAKVGQTFRLDLVLDIDLADASRTDKLKDTVSYDMVVKTVSEAFCARRYRLVEAAAGAVAEAVLEALPAGAQCSRHRAQAACPDRRDLRRRRRDDNAHAEPQTWLSRRLARCSRSAAMSATCGRPSIAPSRCCATATAVRLLARSSDYRTPPWGVTDQPPFVNAVIAVATSLNPRDLGSRDRGGTRARPRPRQTNAAGDRARSISTSSPMTTSS